MAADAGVSVGVVIAGLIINATGWAWVDPLTSLLIDVEIFFGTWGLLKSSLDLAMHAVPPGIDPTEVDRYLSDLPGIAAVHDLHIWGMSTTEKALNVHLVKPDVANDDQLLKQIQGELHDRFGIEHVTIQIERSSDPAHCSQSPPGVV